MPPAHLCALKATVAVLCYRRVQDLGCREKETGGVHVSRSGAQGHYGDLVEGQRRTRSNFDIFSWRGFGLCQLVEQVWSVFRRAKGSVR